MGALSGVALAAVSALCPCEAAFRPQRCGALHPSETYFLRAATVRGSDKLGGNNCLFAISPPQAALRTHVSTVVDVHVHSTRRAE